MRAEYWANRLGLLGFCWFVWLLLIYKWGYFFGSGDHVELLPLVLKAVNPNLYQQDFFVQGIWSFQPNERTVMVALLKPFHKHLEWACLIGHFLSTCILVGGFWAIYRKYIKSSFLTALLIIAALVFLYGRTLGGVELYYNTFQASNLAKGILVWALYLWLEKRGRSAYLLLALATLIQITAGLTTAIIIGFVDLIILFRKENSLSSIRNWLIYLIPVLPFIILIFWARSGMEGAEPETYFSILFEFRHPHHFLLSGYSLNRILLVSAFALAIILVFYRIERRLSLFALTAAIFISVYAILVESTHNPTITSLQFYKASIWLKPLAFLALGVVIERFFPNRIRLNSSTQLGMAISLLLASGFFMNYLVKNPQFSTWYNRHWFGQYRSDPEVDISLKTLELVPDKALLVQPFDFTAHKYFGQVSSWVDFKANVRHPGMVEEWYSRVCFIYDLDQQKGGFNLKPGADLAYSNLSKEKTDYLRDIGVSHMITFRGKEHGLVLYSNEKYSLVKL